MDTALSTEARQVLELAATGLSTADIANRLGMPVATAHRYLDEALDALEASSRLDAIIKAAQLRLIDVPI